MRRELACRAQSHLHPCHPEVQPVSRSDVMQSSRLTVNHDDAVQVANVYSGKGFDAAYPWLVTVTYFVGGSRLSLPSACQRVQSRRRSRLCNAECFAVAVRRHLLLHAGLCTPHCGGEQHEGANLHTNVRLAYQYGKPLMKRACSASRGRVAHLDQRLMPQLWCCLLCSTRRIS
jgi:hypothetical protein